MERSKTKFLAITNRSRQQNLRQAAKHHWNCISSEERKCDELFASPHSNKVLETKQNNLKRVLRFWWCGEAAARLSNQVGVNNCFLSKLQSFSVHMMMCESITAASLRSNICHLFPSKSWKWCLNFFLSFLFFYLWLQIGLGNFWPELPIYHGVVTLNF